MAKEVPATLVVPPVQEVLQASPQETIFFTVVSPTPSLLEAKEPMEPTRGSSVEAAEEEEQVLFILTDTITTARTQEQDNTSSLQQVSLTPYALLSHRVLGRRQRPTVAVSHEAHTVGHMPVQYF